ncbi:MAG: SGNH/GDSL hydrolase family protein [Methanoregula sp.]
MDTKFFTIAPQMKDYLDTAHVHMPYVMHMNRPSVSSPYFSTDSFGFRTTLHQGKPLALSDYYGKQHSGRRAALVGDSTSFGVGATSDVNSISSLLNNQTGYTWFNFSGRTFQSTQELILYLLYRPPDVEKIIILSGINNFDLAYRWFGDIHTYIPPYHLQNLYQDLLLSPSKNAVVPRIRKYFRNLTRQLIKGKGLDPGKTTPDDTRSFCPEFIRNRLYYGATVFPDLLKDPSGLTRSLERFRRDMEIWSDITQNGEKCRVTFILQPIAEWNKKTLSPEEKMLFDLVKQQRGVNWAKVSSYLLGNEEKYRSAVKRICQETGIDFIDANDIECFKTEEWLFLDRYHLTDRGQKIMADVISEKINGMRKNDS